MYNIAKLDVFPEAQECICASFVLQKFYFPNSIIYWNDLCDSFYHNNLSVFKIRSYALMLLCTYVLGSSCAKTSSTLALVSAKLAAEVGSSYDCYVVPAFSGLYAPYWDPTARG